MLSATRRSASHRYETRYPKTSHVWEVVIVRREKEAYVEAERRLMQSILNDTDYPGRDEDIERIRRHERERPHFVRWVNRYLSKYAS